jgi:hypothetical protein
MLRNPAVTHRRESYSHGEYFAPNAIAAIAPLPPQSSSGARDGADPRNRSIEADIASQRDARRCILSPPITLRSPCAQIGNRTCAKARAFKLAYTFTA